MNPRLRTAIQAAKQANMPKDNILEQSANQKFQEIKTIKV